MADINIDQKLLLSCQWFHPGTFKLTCFYLQGGSLGKGTAIKGKADLDVVMYVSNRFHDMQSFLRGIGPAINDLKREIKRWSDQRSGVGRVNLGDTTRHAVKMSIQYSRLDGTEEIDVDLLPAINILAQGKTRS